MQQRTYNDPPGQRCARVLFQTRDHTVTGVPVGPVWWECEGDAAPTPACVVEGPGPLEPVGWMARWAASRLARLWGATLVEVEEVGQ